MTASRTVMWIPIVQRKYLENFWSRASMRPHSSSRNRSTFSSTCNTSSRMNQPEALRQSVQRERPFGRETWARRIAKQLGARIHAGARRPTGNTY